MPKYYESLQLNHTETLLDVVFGVVIGLALIELPALLLDAFSETGLQNYTASILLISTLLFAAFYWLEVRHFIQAQSSFNQALRKEEKLTDDAVPLPLATFLIGSLAMMTIATAMLVYAVAGNFTAFSIASCLFWLCDLGGTAALKSTYRDHRDAIEEIRLDHTVDHQWFLGHITSGFFILYGLSNVLVFSLVIWLDAALEQSELFRLIAALAILGFTLFRHLLWRSRIYSWWAQRKISSGRLSSASRTG